MNITIDNLKSVLEALRDLPDDAQQIIKDKLMICSENDWHDLTHSSTDNLIDTYNDSYTWYREDELEQYGYIHEGDLMEQAVEDIEGLCKALSREKEPQTIISIDILHKLYTGDDDGLTAEEVQLCEAILDENGLEYDPK